MLRLFRFSAGLLAGVALWWFATEPYNHLLSVMSQPIVRLDHRFASATLEPAGRRVAMRQPPPVPGATLPADQLTINTILAIALFSAVPPKRVKAWWITAGVLVLSHVFALLVVIESTAAMGMGVWSEQHYGSVAANAWFIGELVLRSVGLYAIVFASWWTATDVSLGLGSACGAAATAAPRPRKRARAARS